MLLKKAVTKGIIYLLFYSVDIHNPMVMKHWNPAVPQVHCLVMRWFPCINGNGYPYQVTWLPSLGLVWLCIMGCHSDDMVGWCDGIIWYTNYCVVISYQTILRIISCPIISNVVAFICLFQNALVVWTNVNVISGHRWLNESPSSMKRFFV